MSYDDTATLTIKPPRAERTSDVRIVWQVPRLMTFEEYLDEFEGRREHIELVEGVPVERMAAQFPHETLQFWLGRLLGDLAEDNDLGTVLGSRTAVRIDKFGGRLPDLLFIRIENMSRMQNKAFYGTPDLVIEIRSPGDRPAALHALERDYRVIGVPEMFWIDINKKEVRILRKRDDDYEETIINSGIVKSESMTGLALNVAWLFQDPLPKKSEVYEKMKQLAG